jgi:hypothetical protein
VEGEVLGLAENRMIMKWNRGHRDGP